MNPNTLFRWFVNKLIFIAAFLVLTASWWLASLKYENQLTQVKADLLTAALEANNTDNLTNLNLKKLNYSIIDKNGVIISDKKFGSMANVTVSENFDKAITGKATIEASSDDNGRNIEYWGLVKYKGEPHVIVVRKEVESSKIKYFISYTVILAVIVLIILLAAGTLITNPVQDALTYLNDDLKDIRSGKFEKKQTSLDTIEFAEVYETYNKMSKFIQHELNTLRSDLNQWEVFFSTMPRGLIAIDDQRIIQNCNANSLQML
ncbi:MAG: hypothetical protein NE327_22770, partial [Lentisphaeraceae bacterium]|nr:hypothetical protein [Lentisphaeraceae bacterium]